MDTLRKHIPAQLRGHASGELTGVNGDWDGQTTRLNASLFKGLELQFVQTQSKAGRDSFFLRTLVPPGGHVAIHVSVHFIHPSIAVLVDTGAKALF
ncbi:hypothetical protein BJV74DRAFT_837214 [Russula compacta]|nr:hypothetical protein BJV74DRAFT_837214 [Russula compacta]